MFLALILFCFILPPILCTTTKASVKKADIAFLNDSAGLLSASEYDDISERLISLSNKLDLQVAILTITNSEGYTLKEHARLYLEKYNFSEECVLLTINMDPSNREVQVRGFGKAKRYINNKRAQSITDGMVSDLKSENYYEGMLFYLDRVDYYMNHKIAVLLPMLGCILLGSMLIASIIVFSMVHNAGGKDTTTCSTYLDTSTSKILAKRDIYTHTTTTRTKKSSSSSGGSGGGGHSSGSTGSSKF